MMRPRTTLLLVAALSLPFPAAAAAPGPREPLAMIDFASGVSRNLSVVGQAPPPVDFEGGRWLRLAPEPVSQPLEWPADMPDPGFPGVSDPAARRADVEAPSLVLALGEPPGGDPRTVACVLTVYDYTESNRGNNTIRLAWTTGSGSGSGRFQLSGNPYSRDPLHRPRPVRKMVTAEDMLLENALEGGVLKLEAPTTLYLARVELFVPPGWAEAARALGPRPEMLAAHGPYEAAGSVLTLWEQDVSDLMVEQVKTYADRVDAEDAARTLLRLAARQQRRARGLPPPGRLEGALSDLAALVERSGLRMDDFYYDGRAALVAGDWAAYASLLGQTLESLRAVRLAAADLAAAASSGFAVLREVPGLFAGDPPAPVTGRDEFRRLAGFEDRVLFTTFANGYWERFDRFNSHGRYLPLLGIDTKGFLGGSPRVEADGSLHAGDVAHRLERLREEHAMGWDFAPLIGHHEIHTTQRAWWSPRWLAEKSEDSLFDVDHAGNERRPNWNIWNPLVADYFLDSIRGYARLLRDRPRVHKLYCWSELRAGTGYGRSAREAFRRWLTEKYGGIEALNGAWGTGYRSFAEIEPPPAPGEELRRRATGLAYNFEKFRRDSFTEWWRQARRHLRAGDPEARLWLEGWGRYDYLLRHGMDQLALFEAADLAAVHTGSAGQDAQRTWQLALSRYTGTPVSDGEVNIYGPYYAGFADMEQLRAAAEQHLLLQTFYNVRLFMFWSSQINMFRVYSYTGPYLYDSNRVSPVSSSGTALRIVRRKADLYDPLIRKTQAAEPGVGILFSSTSFINSWPYNELEHEMLPLHGWLYHSDFGYRVVHEDAIADGREDLYSLRVLIAPWAAWLQPEAAREIAEWVKRGGVLISSGPPGAFDQYGRPLNTILEPAFGAAAVSYGGHERPAGNRLDTGSIARLRSLGDHMSTHFGGWYWNIDFDAEAAGVETVLALADGTPVVYRASSGDGALLVAAGPLGKNGLRRLVLAEVAARVRPLVRRGVDDGFHVLPRRDVNGNLYLAVVNQSVDETISDTLLVAGRYDNIRERTLHGDWRVPATFSGGRTAVDLRLAPGEGTVLMLGAAGPRDDTAYPRRPGPAGSGRISVPGGWSLDKWEAARAAVAGRWLDAAARAEALALLNASLRAASLGYEERAVRLMALAAGLRRFEKPFYQYPDDRAEAFYAPAPVTVDGDPADWRDVPRYPVRGTADSGGEFAFQWDEENLYLLLVARDQSLRRVEEAGGDFNWIWNYDGLNLVINAADSAPLTVGGALYDAKYRAGQSALLVSITGRRYANSPSGFSGASVTSAVREIEGGYIMEVAIPLRDIMVPPVAGAEISFNIDIVNDGRRSGFSFFSDRESWQDNPLIFARLRLAGP